MSSCLSADAAFTSTQPPSPVACKCNCCHPDTNSNNPQSGNVPIKPLQKPLVLWPAKSSLLLVLRTPSSLLISEEAAPYFFFFRETRGGSHQAAPSIWSHLASAATAAQPPPSQRGLIKRIRLATATRCGNAWPLLYSVHSVVRREYKISLIYNNRPPLLLRLELAVCHPCAHATHTHTDTQTCLYKLMHMHTQTHLKTHTHSHKGHKNAST